MGRGGAGGNDVKDGGSWDGERRGVGMGAGMEGEGGGPGWCERVEYSGSYKSEA